MRSLDFAAVSHRGVVRPVNEDSILAVPPVFCVADGIGGSDSGELASSIVAGEFNLLAESAGRQAIDSEAVSDTLQRAHEQVSELSRTLPNGAASTAAGCIALEVDGRAYWLVFNVGDSRVYRCFGAPGHRKIRQVSVDHSLVQEMIDSGTVSKGDSFRHPEKNMVTRAVGADDGCEPDFWMLPMVRGERLMICTDGLLGDSPSEEVRRLVKADLSPRQVVDDLLELALRSGARDNVSVIVIDVPEVDGSDQGLEPLGGFGSDEPTRVALDRREPSATTSKARATNRKNRKRGM